ERVRLRPGRLALLLPRARPRAGPDEGPPGDEDRRAHEVRPGANPLFYNTNGFAFHRLEDAARILSSLGYDGVALTPDVHHLAPFRASPSDVPAFRRLLDQLRLSALVETGARFVLDPARKHRPSLLDDPADAARRLDYLKRCVDLAAALGAPVVSTWSGSGPA